MHTDHCGSQHKNKMANLKTVFHEGREK